MTKHIHNRVEYDSLDKTTHDFVQMCGIYGIVEGCVYNTENDTFPTKTEIAEEMITGGI